MNLPPMIFGKSHEGEHIALGRVHAFRHALELRPKVVGDVLAQAAEVLSYQKLANELRELASPSDISEDVLPGYTDVIQTRLQQLEKRLSQPDRLVALRLDPVHMVQQTLRSQSSPLDD